VVSVGAGTPEGTLTFTATARTDSLEQSTDNNTIQASTTYVPQGFISGRVWLDEDRDGQRDAGEPAVGSGADGVRLLQTSSKASRSRPRCGGCRWRAQSTIQSVTTAVPSSEPPS
jgi:hypothetical protein